MRCEVWELAADCSSFSLSHTSSLMTGAAKSFWGEETSIQYKSSLEGRRMLKTKRGKLNQTERERRGWLQQQQFFGDPLFYSAGVSRPWSLPAPSICRHTGGESTHTASRHEANNHQTSNHNTMSISMLALLLLASFTCRHHCVKLSW